MKHKRRIQFIKPRFQARLIGSFVGLAALAMLLQFLLLGTKLMTVAAGIPGGGAELAAEIPSVLLTILTLSGLIFLPIIFVFGIRITFRIAGPIYRFERFLKDVAEGRESQPCSIRSEDQLHELCLLMNAATEMPRARNAEVQARETASKPSVAAA